MDVILVLIIKVLNLLIQLPNKRVGIHVYDFHVHVWKKVSNSWKKGIHLKIFYLVTLCHLKKGLVLGGGMY